MKGMMRWLSDEEQTVWRRWLRVNAQLTAALQRDLQEDGVSLPDFEVLVLLTDAPDGRVRVSDLAGGLEWERSRVSHHVTRMEKRGLVRREDCPSDRRGAFVAVTPEGRQAIEEVAPSHVVTVRRLFFDPLDESDVADVGAALGKLEARLADDAARVTVG